MVEVGEDEESCLSNVRFRTESRFKIHAREGRTTSEKWKMAKRFERKERQRGQEQQAMVVEAEDEAETKQKQRQRRNGRQRKFYSNKTSANLWNIAFEMRQLRVRTKINAKKRKEARRNETKRSNDEQPRTMMMMTIRTRWTEQFVAVLIERAERSATVTKGRLKVGRRKKSRKNERGRPVEERGQILI